MKRNKETDGKTSNKKQKLSREAKTLAEKKRGWESWTSEEKERFFDALKENGRDFDTLTEKVGTKNYEQVRHFYYRLIKKINNLIKPEAIDKKDQREILSVLLTYWHLKIKIGQKEENTEDFAISLREAVAQMRSTSKPKEDPLKKKNVQIPGDCTEINFLSEKPLPHSFSDDQYSTDNDRVKVQLAQPEKLTVQLVPKSKYFSDVISQLNQNPRLQLTLKSKKPISYIIDYVSKKWGNVTADPIRLYPPSTMYPSHNGWGIEDETASTIIIYHLLGCPDVLRLEYSWMPPSQSKGLPSISSYLNIETPKFPYTLPSPLSSPSPNLVPTSPSGQNNMYSDVLMNPLPSPQTPVLNNRSETDPSEDSNEFFLIPKVYPSSPIPGPVDRFREPQYSDSPPRHVNNPSIFSPPAKSINLGMSANDTFSGLFEEESSDGLSYQSKMDEMACKSHYKFFEQSSQDNSLFDSQNNVPGLNAKETNSRKTLNFKNCF